MKPVTQTPSSLMIFCSDQWNWSKVVDAIMQTNAAILQGDHEVMMQQASGDNRMYLQLFMALNIFVETLAAMQAN